MKKNITYIITSFIIIFTACENEIPFDAKNNPPKLILNTLIESHRDTNYVILALSGKDKISLVKDPVINIYINSKLKGQLTNEDLLYAPEGIDSYTYQTCVRFSPGDIVKVEAQTNDDAYHAWAEDMIPKPIEIESIETMQYNRTAWNNNESFFLRIKTTFTDNPSEKNYYRLSAILTSAISGISGYTGNDTIISGTANLALITNEDIVLNEGRPVLDNENMLFPTAENRFNVFDDTYLNGTYTMTVSCHLYYFSTHPDLSEVQKISQEININLISITESQYHHFRALNLYESDFYDDYFSQPISFLSNIQGGIGILGLGSGTTKTIKLPDYYPGKN